MFSFSMGHLILSMGIFIIKHYIIKVEKQNKFFVKYYLGIMLKAYNEFESRVEHLN